MDKPLPIGMRFGAEIECYIRIPDGISLRDIRTELKSKYPSDNVDLLTKPGWAVAYWLLFKYETWAQGKQVYSLKLNPGDFWLGSQGDPAAKALAQTAYGGRQDSWGVELDASLNSTIAPNDANRIFPFEFVSSPIAVNFSGQEDPFKLSDAALSSFFKFFEDQNIVVYSRTSTSMHIHLTPIFPDGKFAWTFDTIMSLGLCSAWFEPALCYVLPKDRRKNKFCIEYYNNVRWLQDTDSRRWPNGQPTGLPVMENLVDNMVKAFRSLQRQTDGKPVEQLCQVLQAGGDKPDGDYRYAAWNFSNMYKNKRGAQYPPIKTVEFRQPPGCASAAEALDWVKYTVIFSMQACKYGTSELLPLVVTNFPRRPTDDNMTKLKQLYDCSDQGLQDFLARPPNPAKPAENLAIRCKFTVLTLVLRQDEFHFVLDYEKDKLKPEQVGPVEVVNDHILKTLVDDYEEQRKKDADRIRDLRKNWEDQKQKEADAAALAAIKSSWVEAMEKWADANS